MANVREVSDEARRAIADFRSKDGPAQGLMADMRVTLTQAREATADLADNMEAMKHNFLLRGFFNRRGYFDLDAISPAEYRNGVLENGKRKAMRIWLASAGAVRGGPGRHRDAHRGRPRADRLGDGHLPQVRAGQPDRRRRLCDRGTAGERFRVAKARRRWSGTIVMERYELMPQNTGFIALGTEAQGSPAGDQWDGVALTLFLDREQLQFAAQQATVAVSR